MLVIASGLVAVGILLLWYGYLKRGGSDETQWDWKLVPFLISALSDPGEAFFYGVGAIALGGMVIVFWFLSQMGVV